MCLGQGAADATATHYLLLLLVQIGFTFLVLPFCVGSPGWSRTKSKRVIERLCVCA